MPAGCARRAAVSNNSSLSSRVATTSFLPWHLCLLHRIKRANGLCATKAGASRLLFHGLSVPVEIGLNSSPPTMASDSGKAAPEGNSKKLTLYSYWYSSCSQRVRIALNLKEFEKLNPLHFIPVLVDEGIVVADSFAIILYLEEKYPQHPLLPHDLQKKAINYQVANIVSSSIQPLQNLPVLNYIEEKFNADKKLEWVQYHVGRGFAALEKLLESHAGKYATGDELLLADVFLAPQIYAGAVRFKIDMTHYPILARLMVAYDEVPAFQAARPEMQPDYPSTS